MDLHEAGDTCGPVERVSNDML
ncbi:hypothetical protein XFF6166_520033 [Xanthomonas citri pv. fuscans]|nr:hypothetical protein XFF6166_520033 [Xanthomonas citri pv. fuscans]SON98816.1 hypothetical protein XFF7767_1060054 [Xanthomonas citri pv. fuscans]SOO01429.1 hypothetical protein XFF6960_480057 [Xanthomonas citri pv. fuscans]SOO09995.1 hypothetical protein XFF6970_490130 [Xanthomonas citri pv. fuscans]SOO13970.1 hypothetical protein XFF7766_260073 [Xanthomonas citri pv. fuscans]